MSSISDTSAAIFDDSTVELRVKRVARIDLEQVPGVLGAPEASWLGERVGRLDPDETRRHFACDLKLRVQPRSFATFHKAAIVSLGAPAVTNEGWRVPCEWRAAGLAPLFPVFSGNLRFERKGLALEGFYAPPFGALGLALDYAVLNVVARGTARWFLRQVAAQLSKTLPEPY